MSRRKEEANFKMAQSRQQVGEQRSGEEVQHDRGGKWQQ